MSNKVHNGSCRVSSVWQRIANVVHRRRKQPICKWRCWTCEHWDLEQIPAACFNDSHTIFCPDTTTVTLGEGFTILWHKGEMPAYGPALLLTKLRARALNFQPRYSEKALLHWAQRGAARKGRAVLLENNVEGNLRARTIVRTFASSSQKARICTHTLALVSSVKKKAGILRRG